MFYIKNITSGDNGKNHFLVLYEQLNLSEHWL